MISYDNRKTQEVSPNATIIATVTAGAYVISQGIGLTYFVMIDAVSKKDYWQRLMITLILVITILILRPLAMNEIKIKRQS